MSDAIVTTISNEATVAEVVAIIERDGGVIIEDFLSADTLEGLRADLYPRLAATPVGTDDGIAGVRTRRLGRLFAHSRHMAAVALHPLYIGAAEAIIEQPVHMWVGEDRVSITPGLRVGATQTIQIGPGQKAQPLHRDDLVFMWRHPLYEREARCQIMVALSDFTAENGGTLVIPGSHRWDDERKPERWEAVPTVMKAGSAMIFVGSVYHAGGENRSDEARTGLSMTLDAANLRQEENMYLSLSSDVVKSYPKQIQRLLGWSAGKNYMGWIEVDGQMVDPITLLQDGDQLDRSDMPIRIV